jgi:hypothetical protein
MGDAGLSGGGGDGLALAADMVNEALLYRFAAGVKKPLR